MKKGELCSSFNREIETDRTIWVLIIIGERKKQRETREKVAKEGDSHLEI